MIVSTVAGPALEYSGNQMSDGEKAALFVAGRVFSAERGILVVDEPETHFHSLLAVRLWNALEDARPDLRFVYVTHDLTFALSRRRARYVLASPTAGLRPIAVDDALPSDVSEALLGSASLSFYASRIVFCEGESGGRDESLYGAWFSGPDTVLRSVGSCQMVIRCVEALRAAGVRTHLTQSASSTVTTTATASSRACPPESTHCRSTRSKAFTLSQRWSVLSRLTWVGKLTARATSRAYEPRSMMLKRAR